MPEFNHRVSARTAPPARRRPAPDARRISTRNHGAIAAGCFDASLQGHTGDVLDGRQRHTASMRFAFWPADGRPVHLGGRPTSTTINSAQQSRRGGPMARLEKRQAPRPASDAQRETIGRLAALGPALVLHRDILRPNVPSTSRRGQSRKAWFAGRGPAPSPPTAGCSSTAPFKRVRAGHKRARATPRSTRKPAPPRIRNGALRGQSPSLRGPPAHG